MNISTIEIMNHPFECFKDAYCIGDASGYWCGHNTVIYIKKADMSPVDCPTVFRSKVRAYTWLRDIGRWAADNERPHTDFRLAIPSSARFEVTI
jgi:hypothetical protein